MERTERLVSTFMSSQRAEESSALVLDIQNGASSLLNLVKALGEYITSENDDLRTNALELLSSVLAQCSPASVNRHSMRVLTTFYCEKLADAAALVPALKGMLALTKLPAFGEAEAKEIATALPQSIDMRMQTQTTRYHVFQLIDQLMTEQRRALKALGEAFVTGWLKLASGEKDPRNLLIAFPIYRIILIEFPIMHEISDIFDSTFCYLPITFRPPPNDPYGITSDDLIQALRSVITATPEFGPKALPLFIEKLTLGSPSIRRDILQTLEASLPIYGPAIAYKHATDFWRTLKVEIFQPTDALTENDALNAIKALIAVLYSDSSTTSSDSIEGLAKDICSECAEILQEPNKSQAKPAVKMLSSIVATTYGLARFALNQTLPPLLNLFIAPEGHANRHAILSCLSMLIAAVQKRQEENSENNAVSLLEKYKDPLLGVLEVGLKSETDRRAALAALSSAIDIPGLFTGPEIGYIVHNINEVTFNNKELDETPWDSSIFLLKKIAITLPSAVESTTLPLLFSFLPDAPNLRDIHRRQFLWRVLSALEDLCLPAPLFETLMVRLLAKIDIVCGIRYYDSEKSILSSPVEYEERAAYAHAMLFTLSKVLQDKVIEKHPEVPKYLKDVLDRLYNLFILSALQDDAEACVATKLRLVQIGANIATLVSQSLTEDKQTEFLLLLFKLFLDGDLHSISGGRTSPIPSKAFKPFHESASAHQKQCVILFVGPLISLKPQVALPTISLDDFISMLLSWALDLADNDVESKAIHICVGSLVNKKGDELSRFLSENMESYWSQHVENKSEPIERRKRALDGWLCITRALVFRNHPSSTAFIDKLFSAFGDVDISIEAGSAIGILGGSDKSLKKSNHAIVKILHSQKYANIVLPRLIAGARGSSSSSQIASLVALSSMIKAVPRTIYASQLSELMPLLLRGLELPDDDLRTNVIETLHEATQEGSIADLVADYASTLVSSMLKLITGEGDKKASTRLCVSALKYLAVLPEAVDYHILHPQKILVIRSLGSLLDDSRRSIRTEAAETRAAWYTYKGGSE